MVLKSKYKEGRKKMNRKLEWFETKEALCLTCKKKTKWVKINDEWQCQECGTKRKS